MSPVRPASGKAEICPVKRRPYSPSHSRSDGQIGPRPFSVPSDGSPKEQRPQETAPVNGGIGDIVSCGHAEVTARSPYPPLPWHPTSSR